MKRALLVLVGLVVGGYTVMGIVRHNEMVQIVKSDEVKAIIENNLKQRHKGALEEGNIIQSYEIDKDSIFLSPMGGIKFRVFINNNKEMYVNFSINKDPRYTDGRLVNEGGGPSLEFEKLISESGNE
jgi:hypothetical secreted protein